MDSLLAPSLDCTYFLNGLISATRLFGSWVCRGHFSNLLVLVECFFFPLFFFVPFIKHTSMWYQLVHLIFFSIYILSKFIFLACYCVIFVYFGRDLFLHSADRYRKACDNPLAIVGEAHLTVLIDEKTAGMSLVPNS